MIRDSGLLYLGHPVFRNLSPKKTFFI